MCLLLGAVAGGRDRRCVVAADSACSAFIAAAAKNIKQTAPENQHAHAFLFRRFWGGTKRRPSYYFGPEFEGRANPGRINRLVISTFLQGVLNGGGHTTGTVFSAAGLWRMPRNSPPQYGRRRLIPLRKRQSSRILNPLLRFLAAPAALPFGPSAFRLLRFLATLDALAFALSTSRRRAPAAAQVLPLRGGSARRATGPRRGPVARSAAGGGGRAPHLGRRAPDFFSRSPVAKTTP